MTTPPPPNSALTVVQWQAQLLSRIRFLAAEHARIHDAGWDDFEPAADEQPRDAWLTHLDALESERERTEQTAVSAGIELAWIEDARTLGSLSYTPRPDIGARTNPTRDDAAQSFYLDMLTLDLWHLERMAGLAAARADRIATGRWSVDTPAQASAVFDRNMALYHQRVTALAHAAGITAPEAELLWGGGGEPVRREQARHLDAYDELTLVQEWNYYATERGDLPIPPYIPDVPATDASHRTESVTPPTPQQMIAAAEAALRAEFIDAALHHGLDDADLATDSLALTAAIDAALPTGEHTWDTTRDPVGDPTSPFEPIDAGPDVV
ncbi:Uncharacterised protein [Nocardia farcinica]|uniref:hypothetical protein n=1 Tax=Nocardia farcinica TaxID=37329 RepID=UPI000E03DB8E|nr:hypothetical protein [Nocardia farcinica]SUE28931.1 Uncharacterised protein [Nocardia farcinica]